MEYHKLLSSDVYQGNGWTLNAKGIHKEIAYLIYSNAFPACYLGIHKNCKAYDLIGLRDMAEIYFERNECTFTGKGGGKQRPKDFLWLGWDYGHLGDFTTYQAEFGDTSGHKYTIDELMDDIYSNINEVKNNFRYAFVNGRLKYMPLNWSMRSQGYEDCVIQYVNPEFTYGNYDPDIIKDFELE